MKLEFKFGYIHMLKWLVTFKIRSPAALDQAPWDLMMASYQEYWIASAHREYSLDRLEAEKIIHSLRKL
jgi:hypothetical protein